MIVMILQIKAKLSLKVSRCYLLKKVLVKALNSVLGTVCVFITN